MCVLTATSDGGAIGADARGELSDRAARLKLHDERSRQHSALCDATQRAAIALLADARAARVRALSRGASSLSSAEEDVGRAEWVAAQSAVRRATKRLGALDSALLGASDTAALAEAMPLEHAGPLW